MENAKQKAIEVAYGIHWNKVKDFVDENGWFNNGHQEDRFYFTFGNNKIGFEYKDDILLRPKSLSGIETNNNWISINSEDDLPKIKGNYWAIDKILETNPVQEYFDPENLISMKERWLFRISHYKPFISPEKPIY